MSGMIQYLRELHFASVVVRLALAMLLGGCIGLERGRKRRPAGFRTYMLVCLGAALTVLLSLYEFTMVTGPWSDICAEIGIKTDVSRFGAQVINGIGFLGAGTILVTGRQQVKGLTTAAGLWASACTGLAVGAGFYECVLLGFVLIFLVVRVLPRLEVYVVEHAKNMNIYIEMRSLDHMGELFNRLKSQNVTVYEVDIDREVWREARRYGVTLAIRLQQRQSHDRLMAELSDLDDIYSVEELK